MEKNERDRRPGFMRAGGFNYRLMKEHLFTAVREHAEE